MYSKKIIDVWVNDYLILYELSKKSGESIPDIIHNMLNPKASGKYTQIIIDVWLNYWSQEHKTIYDFKAKDGIAAKRIGIAIGKNLGEAEPSLIGQVFEKILLMINKDSWYYGKELTVIQSNINGFIADVRRKNQPDISGNW